MATDYTLYGYRCKRHGNAAAAQEYGRIREELERVGRPIGNNDLWIAAHASALKVSLVTNNRREFDRVKGLSIEDWSV